MMIQLDIPEHEYSEFNKQAIDDIVNRNKQAFTQPSLQMDYGRFVVLHNLPNLTEERKSMMQKALGGCSAKLNIPPFKSVRLSLKGKALLEYENDDQAQVACRLFNGLQFDQKHILQAYTIKELEYIESIQEYKPLKIVSSAELLKFMDDAQKRPQIMYIQNKTKLTLQWMNQLEKKFEDYASLNFQKYRDVQWSLNGSYLVLIDDESFSLYGSDKLELLHQFNHVKISNLVFSPFEKYVISKSSEQLFLWDVRAERKLRIFSNDKNSQIEFSPDEQLLARAYNNEIILYDAPEFYQMGEALKFEGIQQICWTHNQNNLAIAQYGNNIKPKIQLLNVKTNQIIRWKNIICEVESIQFFPNDLGKWLGCLIKRKTKDRISSSILQIGNLYRTDPLQTAELVVEEDVQEVFYEKHSGKFALSYRAKDKQQKPTQQFNFHLGAVIEESKNNISVHNFANLEQKETNQLLWASNGQYFVLVNNINGSPDQGKVEFWGVSKKTEKDVTHYSAILTKSTNHFYMSHAQWDPSGLFIVTMSDLWHSVNIWSSIGELLIKDSITKINEIKWRNRPIHILSAQQESNLQQNSKVFIKKYEQEDDKILNKAKYEKEQNRNEMKKSFTNYLKEKQQRYQDSKQQRIELLGFDEDEIFNQKIHSVLVK